MDRQPNILLITADDMNRDAVGAFGGPVDGATPRIDRLAAEGVCFDHAHVTIAVCQPSRSALMTGRYPHRSGGEGFFHLRFPGVPILPEHLRAGGYMVGILGKATHSTPYADFRWDMCIDRDELGEGRNPGLYAQHARDFLSLAGAADQPFFLMLNSHDPHRPFFGNDDPEWYAEDTAPPARTPSRVFASEEVTTPGFLPDLPEVRREIAEYYSSVRRCDDTVGAALDALHEAGCAENTIVVFLSDNGMAFPFAKTNCYLHSTKTPWIVRWPGVIRPGARNNTHFISGIDLMPTLLDAAGLEPPARMDGASFLPLLRGEDQGGRDQVFTQFHQTAGRNSYPMRCVQNRRFGYIFNPWSDGRRIFHNESQSGRTMQAMREAAGSDPALAARVDIFLHRVPEELYDFGTDPDALHNLAGDPACTDELHAMQQAMEGWMREYGDPALDAFRHRSSPEALEAFMAGTAFGTGE